jgi:hypothetical protein
MKTTILHKEETNFMTGIATVYHDESVTLAEIKQCAADCGIQYSGKRIQVTLTTALGNRAPLGWLKAVAEC